MQVKTICGDDIDQALTSAMYATVSAMVHEGLVDEDDANDFCECHFCKIVDESVVWKLIRRWLHMKASEQRVVVFRVAVPVPKEDSDA